MGCICGTCAKRAWPKRVIQNLSDTPILLLRQRIPMNTTSRLFFPLQITKEEQQVLLTGCKEAFGELPSIHGLAVMGSSPAGVDKETLVDVSKTYQSGCRRRPTPWP